jgi:hypothetical protein
MAEHWSKKLTLNTINGKAVTAELMTGGVIDDYRVHLALEDDESTAFAYLTPNMARDLANELIQAADKAEARDE